jgi:hypothetical protein
VRGPIEDAPVAPSCPHIEAGSQTMGRGYPTASSCRVDANSGTNEISSLASMEEYVDDDLLDYEPSAARDGMEINVIYMSSIDYSLLKEVSQLALGPQDVVFKKPIELGDHLKPV